MEPHLKAQFEAADMFYETRTKGKDMRKFIFLTLSIAVSFSASAKPWVHNASAESDPEEQQIYFLSYNDFRLMSDTEQEAYIREMQNFITDLASQGVELDPVARQGFFPTRWSWLQELLAEPAFAQSANTTAPVPTTEVYPDGRKKYASDVTLGYTAPKSNPTPTNRLGNVGAKSPSFSTAPADVNGSELLADKKSKTAKAAGDKKTAPANTGKFRCIYAGFTIKGDDCKPQTEYKNGGKTYACTGTGANRVTPTKVDEKKSILCNPILFGLNAGKPICIAYADRKSSTKKCLEESRKIKTSMEDARKLWKTDEASYKLMSETMANFCKGDATTTAYMKDFKGNKEDIKATCVSYAARFNDFNGSGAKGFGTYSEKNNTTGTGTSGAK